MARKPFWLWQAGNQHAWKSGEVGFLRNCVHIHFNFAFI